MLALSWFIRKNGGLIDDIAAILTKYYVDIESWSREFSNKACIILDDEIHTTKKMCFGTKHVYGNSVIRKGECYHWKLQLKGPQEAYVGVIANDFALLKKWGAMRNRWDWINDDDGCLLANKSGIVAASGPGNKKDGVMLVSKKALTQTGNDGDVIEMVLDLQNERGKVTYILNGNNSGCVCNKLPIEKSYRLSVCINKYPDDNKTAIKLI